MASAKNPFHVQAAHSSSAAALRWSLAEASGINDSGVIVGTGEHEGKGRAFLLTPKGK